MSLKPISSVLGLAFVLLAAAHGQNLTNIMPEILTPPPQHFDFNPEEDMRQKDGWGKPLPIPLKGVFFLAGPENQVTSETAAGEGIRAEGLPLLQSVDFQNKIQGLLGQRITSALLETITSTVVAQYQANHSPIVESFVPRQDASNGVLQVMVIAGQLDQVKVRGNKWFKNEVVLRNFDHQAEQGLSEKKRQQNLTDLNRNPFVQVTPEFVAGSDPGTVDLIMRAKEKFPFSTYTGYNNTGNPITGYDRWTNGVNWGNAFGQGHELDYQITTDNLYDRFIAQTARYSIPLPDRQSLTFYGGYITDQGRNPDGSRNRLHGYAWQTSGRYNVPLPTLGRYEQSISVGYDFKESNNNLTFGGSTVLSDPTDISQFAYEYNSSLKDDGGVTKLGLKLFLSPGGMTGQDQSNAYRMMHAGADADYAYGVVSLSRETRLPYDCSWGLRGLYQNASTNLLPSEQFGIGGADTVRGYQDRIANGDQGGLVSGELRAPPLSPSSWFCRPGHPCEAQDQLIFLGFVDYGWVRNTEIQPGERPETELLGAGPGLRYNFGDYVAIRFDYGVQLAHPDLGDANKSRIHVAVNVAF